MERLTRQVDDSRLAHEESVAMVESRFTSFVEASNSNQQHAADRSPPGTSNLREPRFAAAATPRHTDVQHA
jgi:hypothetical protein